MTCGGEGGRSYGVHQCDTTRCYASLALCHNHPSLLQEVWGSEDSQSQCHMPSQAPMTPSLSPLATHWKTVPYPPPVLSAVSTVPYPEDTQCPSRVQEE